MDFHHATLPNGLQIVAELNDRAHSIASGFFVKAGSRDETADIAGLSHFLEHMVFKGTPRRDALTVNRDFDRVGAKHNAQTSEEDTVYHVTALPEYHERAFDVLADILRPSLREDDFETEKKVIIEEIKMYLDNPMMVAYEAAKAAHFAPHPLGQSILGSEESITAMTASGMRAYFEAKYSPSNIVVAFTGKAEWPKLLELVSSRCGDWKSGTTSREVRNPRGQNAFQTILRADDKQQTILGVSDGPPLESDARYAAALLTTIVGDHTGSRLYWTLIDPGHADSVEFSYQEYNGAGAFYTFLSCEPEQAQENLERIVSTYKSVMENTIRADELEQAKNKVLARTVLRSERPMGRLMSLGFHWTYRKEYIAVEKDLEAYSAVTLDDLNRVLQSWPLVPMTVVSVGPTTDLKPVGLK